MKSFKIYTLGCKVNQYDSGGIGEKLISLGFCLEKSNVDVAVVNTCSVTKSAVLKNKEMVNRARKENPQAKIILTGCWPKVYKEEADGAGANYVCSMEDIEGLVKDVFHLNDDIVSCHSHDVFLRTNNQERSRYFIKVQDGCEQYCSYCIIPYTRGKLKSRPVEEVVEEIERAVGEGYREIIFSGIHLGLYGREGSNNNIDLFFLLQEVLKIKNLGRIRLSSIEITEVSDELVKLITINKKICKHLHIPLQAGCDKILKRMNRPYDTNYFKAKVEEIRKLVPDVAITTDVIVGFPGETDEDFERTVDFIKEINFSKVHVFSFSVHERTLAAKMDGVVSEKDIKKRSAVLRKLSDELETGYKNKFLGKELELVVDGRSKEGDYRGKTEYYFDVNFREKDIVAGEAQVGEIIKIKHI